MAERDGSARRKKKTKRQTIRVPVDEVPRRIGGGSAPFVAEEELTPEDVAAALVPSADDTDEAPGVLPRRVAAKTVVDVELPASLLESLEEPGRAPDDSPDSGELSVDVDVSDAERISAPPAGPPVIPPVVLPAVPPPVPSLVPPPVPPDGSVTAILVRDRPTPPPKDAPWPPVPDPGDRPTPPPRPPSASALLYPVAPPAVVVMAPIRSIGEPIAEPETVSQAIVEPEPADARPLLPKLRRPTTRQGMPAIPAHVDSLDWAAEDSGEVPFEGSLPGEGPTAESPAEAEPREVVTDGAGVVPIEVEDAEAARLMLPPEPPPVSAATPRDPVVISIAGPTSPPPDDVTPRSARPIALPEAPEAEPPAVIAAVPPAAEAAEAAAPDEADAAFPIDVRDSDPGAAIDEHDSDPGTPIDVDAEALHVASVVVAPEPPPPVARIPSAPKIPVSSPPPPPTPLPVPSAVSSQAVALTTPPHATPLPAVPAPASVPPPVPSVQVPLPRPPPVPGAVVRSDGAERRRKGRKWWEDFFNEEWLKTIPPVPPETTRKECDFIESALGVERTAAILDLGCGTGRHAVELASRGYSVVALDLSVTMLEQAQRAADDRDAKVTFQQADMRDLSFDNSFDAVYCIGTTLGLFDEEGNLQVIRNAHRALRENGTFLIEVVNRDFVLQSQPNVVWFEGDGCVCMEETNINYITSRLQVKRTVMPDEGGQTETEYSVRLFSLHELGSLLHRNGFRVLEVSGHWATRGVFFGAHSQRLVVLAEKRVLSEGLPTITQSGATPLKSGSGS